MINLSHITFWYDNDAEILSDVSLKVSQSAFAVLVGSSGSGKTTLLKLIAGLEKQKRGEVSVEGRVSMVFQLGSLLPWLSAGQNVALPLLAEGLTQHEISQRVRAELTRVGLSDFINKFPRELSGGERQRVGIARALAVKPDILLLDEPFSALDIITADRLRGDLVRIWQELKLTVVMVSHSVEEAAELAQNIYAVKNGELREPIKNSLPYPRDITAPEYAHIVQRIKSAV